MATEDGEVDSGQEHMNDLADQVAEGLGLVEAGEDDGEEKDGDPSTSAEASPAAAPAPAAAAPAPAAAPAVDPNDRAPDSWKPDVAAKWATIPPEVKEEIRRRENDFHEGTAQYKNTATIGEKFGKAVEKYVPLWQANKVDPWNVVTEMLEAHSIMSFGTPEQKVGFFTALAKYAGVDPVKLAEGGGVAASGDFAQLHSLIQRQARELEAMKKEVGGVAGNLHNAKIAEIEAAVTAFSVDPKHAYFTELESDIERLLATGVAKTLEQAYDKALWANPVTRAKEQARQAQEAENARLNKLKERTGNSRRGAAVNVRSRTSRGAAPAHGGSIDETLRDTLADINSRS